MKGKIFLKAVRNLLDPIDKKAPRLIFDIVFSTLSGNVAKGQVTCTSSNFKNDTFNFKFMESGEFRTDNSSMAVEREGMCHTVTLSYLLCREKYSPN